MEDLKQIPSKRAHLNSRLNHFELTKEKGAKIDNITRMSFYEDDAFNDRFYKIVSLIKQRNGCRLRRDSLRYKKIRRAMLKAYAKVLIKVIVNEMIIGNKINFLNQFTFAIENFKDHRKIHRIKYRYIHRYKGQYPMLIIGTGISIFRSIPKILGMDRKGVMLHGMLSKEVNKMVSYQISEKNRKYSRFTTQFIPVIDKNKILKNG